MWVIGARTCKHSRQNTNSSMESYHGVVLKKTLNETRTTSLTRNLQWLLHQLVNVVQLHYQSLVSNFNLKDLAFHCLSIN